MDKTVYFIRVDETYGHISCEDFDTIIRLRDHFSFFADGYQYHPAFRNRSWDGKTRMLKESGQIYLGLWSEVKECCERIGAPFQLDPSIKKHNLPREKFERFVDNLNVHSGGDKIDPYDYQRDAAHFALEMQRCILLSPTSSGKSLIQYIVYRMWELIGPEEQILVVVPTVGLVTQMIGDFKDYSSEIDWSVESECHGIMSGTSKETKKRIVISTYQSLSNKKSMPPREWFEKFKFFSCDEVHTATANSIISIIEKCKNAKYRLGLTGTLDDGECKTNRLTLQGLFGPIKTVITTKELMDAGTVAQLKVKVGLLKHPEKQCKFLRSAPRGPIGENGKPARQKATYAQEIDEITKDKARNRFIMKFTAGLKGNTVLMINKVEHGENLYRWMTQAFPDRRIYLYTGSTDKDERENIRQAMEKEDGSIIIGSLGVLSTGISIKRLHNLILAHPSKSRIKVLQSVGRLLRKSKFGNNVTMYDLVDDYSIGAYENYCLDHGRKRVSYYYDQQFDTQVSNITLEEL